MVDAPCTGLGTLRRNPDLKWRQTPQDLAELTVKQAAILARAARLTKAGGRLIYSTCSLLRDENEQIAEGFLATHPDFKLLNAAEILSQQQINLDTGKYLKLLPHLHHTDGFFAAVFEKLDATAPVKKTTLPEVIQSVVLEMPELEVKAKKAAAVKKPAAPKKESVKKVLKVTEAEVAPKKTKAVVKEKLVKPKTVKAKIAQA